MPTIALPNGVIVHLPYEQDERFTQLAQDVAGSKPASRSKRVSSTQKAIRKNPQAVRAGVDQARYRGRPRPQMPMGGTPPMGGGMM